MKVRPVAADLFQTAKH